jgi:hypothetical protein
MHVVDRPGQFVSSSFPNAASANKREQVVISAPVGWGGGGKGQYWQGQSISSSFPNAASANKSKQVVISAPVSWEWGGGNIIGQDNVFHHHFQMQLLQTRVDR